MLLTLAIPGPAALSVAHDRERRVWTELLLTTLRPSQIVIAKALILLWPAYWSLLLLLPAWLPAAHASRLPGEQVAALLAALAATPLPVVALGLWLSSRFRRASSAVCLAYLVTVVQFWAAPFAAPWSWLGGESPFSYVSPAWQAGLLVLVAPVRSPVLLPLLPEWGWYLLLCGVVTAACLWGVLKRVAE